MNKRNLILAALATSAGLALSTNALAQTFPDRPIRFVVPFAVGGANDIVGRIVANRLSQNIKQSVVVENRPGAGGSIGVTSVVRSPADGYALVLGESGSISIAPSLMKKPTYDSVTDLIPVASLIELPLVIAVHPATRIRNLKDLVAYGTGKSTPYGSAGIGTVQHLTMERLKRVMKLDMTHVAYRGGAPAMADLMAGQIPVLPVSASTAKEPAAGNLILPIAALGKNRSSVFPQLPTAAEQGYPALDVTVWQGVFAPAGTPPAVVEFLATEIRKVLAAPDIRKSITDQGVDIADMPREDFARIVREDSKRWAQVIREGNLTVD
ncbi:Bug family tripartite tricarboxylate transporter substrate binding protein [Ottowia thiooxydans]|uniref:Tripartite-type tricarboxylate transporter receptor subunit TctC n=1 Tax=Ottowia thiooxydans TaxID=219182 RepID=A0ABV2Q684_9BURK